MRLRCISRYQSAKRTAESGDVLTELTPQEAAFLLADAPGCWEDADGLAAADDEAEPDEAEPDDEETKAPEVPEKDKMIRGAPKQK